MNSKTRAPETFDLQHTPLTGSNLLNASAGTGKTYSLAYLYLRLLLEKGLHIEEILVTTFTVAATAELKGRIFETLQQAEYAFQAIINDDELPEDAFLIELITAIRTTINNDKLVMQRLRLALAQFDYAQIYTINGFALQLLRENNDVLNSYIPDVILNDDAEFVKQAYLTLARDNFSSFGTDAVDIGKTVSIYTSEQLFSLLAQMLEYRDYLNNAKEGIFQQAQTTKELVDKALHCDKEAIAQLLHSAFEKKQLKRTTYKEATITKRLEQLHDESAYLDSKFLEFFSRTKLNNTLTKDANVEFTHDVFYLFDELHQNAEDIPLLHHIDSYRALLLLTDALHEKVAELKAQQMALTHNDIIHCVASGANQINTTFKAALIDEAQDTNALQMQLFQRLFLKSSDNIVFFVGDPKQAIYGFRGANIYSYLAIENDVEHHYVMDTNYRSTQSLNDSVNTFFSGHNPFANEQVIYHPINWQKANSESPFGEQSLTWVNAEGNKTEDLAIAAAQTLSTFIQSKNTHPKDIAVLVRTGGQAALMKNTLATYGLSASFTGKVSVYETDEAKLFLALLNAIYSGSSRLTKSLMLSPLFEYHLTDAENQEIVTSVTTTLHGYANDYTRRGFSTMFYRVMNHFSMAGCLLQSNDGKRRLTNFIQIFELLQTVLQKQSLSLAGLCDKLSRLIHNADKEAELRLEDDQAITIMTIHSAKGLEFPVVCLPFFDYDRPNYRTDGLLVSHQFEQATPAFLKPKELLKHVKNEENAESRRLAYVALTRAKYHNIIIRQPTESKTNRKTAMLTELLDTLDNPETLLSGAFIADAPALITHEAAVAEQAETSYQAKQLKTPLYSAWQLESFSRLQQQVTEYHPRTPNAEIPENSQDVISSALIHYPSGARPGTALHEMYEHLLAHRDNDTAFRQAVDMAIDKHLYAEDKKNCPNTKALADAISETAHIQLSPNSFSLFDISTATQSIEMKFFMHLSPVARLALLQTFGIVSHEQTLIPTNGYVHGYIDYCFEHDGLFYVLDYKSNRLGETYSDYDNAGMHTEMQHHRYDLQALIYTLALCKHLHIKSETEYQEKIGGYYYLFVRGMATGKATGIYHDKVEWNKIQPFL